MVTCPNEVANQLKVVQHLLQLEIQAEISSPKHAPFSHGIISVQDNSNNFLENRFNLFVSTSLSLCMSQFLPKSLNGSTGSWTIQNLYFKDNCWAKEDFQGQIQFQKYSLYYTSCFGIFIKTLDLASFILSSRHYLRYPVVRFIYLSRGLSKSILVQ